MQFTSYADVFARDWEDLGHTTTIQHSILTSDDIPVSQCHRRIPPNHLMEVKQHLQELLDKGVIAPSQSSSASPIVLVRKKNGAMRMCVDYVGKFFYNLAEFVFEFFCDSRRISATFAKFCLNSLFATWSYRYPNSKHVTQRALALPSLSHTGSGS